MRTAFTPFTAWIMYKTKQIGFGDVFSKNKIQLMIDCDVRKLKRAESKFPEQIRQQVHRSDFSGGRWDS